MTIEYAYVPVSFKTNFVFCHYTNVLCL